MSFEKTISVKLGSMDGFEFAMAQGEIADPVTPFVVGCMEGCILN